MILATSILLLAVTAVSSQIPRWAYRPRSHDEVSNPYVSSYKSVLDDNVFGPGQISRQETANEGVRGPYSLANAEERTRIVDYVADQDGFRAQVRKNEPGIDNQNPAYVIMESSSPSANRNYQYSQGVGARRPVLAAEESAPPSYRYRNLRTPVRPGK